MRVNPGTGAEHGPATARVWAAMVGPEPAGYDRANEAARAVWGNRKRMPTG